MKLTTAGESHGKALLGIIEGLPSNLEININQIDEFLSLRQGGYGRGGRQKIENDKVEILSGVRNKKTLGSPLAFSIKNADYDNWQNYMAPEGCDVNKRQLTAVRPGHADLTGLKKYSQTDARNILERASARSTAVNVVAGTIARQYLKTLGVEVSGYVKSICGIKDENRYSFEQLEEAKKNKLFMLDVTAESKAVEIIDELKTVGDSAGGVIEIRVKGLKSGFGSCMQADEKLDSLLCSAVMGVQAIKGVEIGSGFCTADLRGSQVHDQIFYNGKFYRTTNNAGGIEGGMSNGEEIVLRAAMKPIPTLMKGLKTVDFVTKQPTVAASERSDVCAICAAEIVLESITAFTVAQAVSKRLGGDCMEQVIKRYGELND